MNINGLFTTRRHPLGKVDYPVFAAIPAAMGAIGAAAGVTGAGVSAATSIAAGTAITTMGLTAVSGGISAFGAYQQGQAQKNLMNYQADVAKQQAKSTAAAAEANITGVQNQAGMKATMLARNASELSGSQRASSGAQGLGSSVTAADVAKDTFTKQQMDQMTLQYNANVSAWNIRNDANNRIWRLGVEGDMDRMAAKNAATAGNIAAGSSLLSTATQIGTESLVYGASNPMAMYKGEGVLG